MTSINVVPTSRLQKIPAPLDESDIRDLFLQGQHRHLEIKSLSPSIRQSDKKVATIAWNVGANSSESNATGHPVLSTTPPLIDTESGIELDDNFNGFTPLNDPCSPIVAE